MRSKRRGGEEPRGEPPPAALTPTLLQPFAKVVTLADGEDVPDWLFDAAMQLKPGEVTAGGGADDDGGVAAERLKPRRRTKKVYD